MTRVRWSLDGRALLTATAFRLPDAEQLAHEDELTDVIGGVIGDEHELAKIRLPGPVRDRGGKIDALVCGNALQRPTIATELGDALLPGCVGARPAR